MKVLITGGAGFIGSLLAKKLTEELKAEVVAFDNLLPQVHPGSVRPKALSNEVRLFQEDIRDARAWDLLLGEFKPDIVAHFAAETGTGQSLTESSRHATVNVAGTAEMLDAFSRANFTPRKVLLSSSRAVYGEGGWLDGDGRVFYPQRRDRADLEKGIWDPLDGKKMPATPMAHKATEIFPTPVSIYGATKLAQEHLLSAWCNAFAVDLCIMRFQNVYGVGQSPYNPYTGIINIFHKIAYNGSAIEVYEDGRIGRDFVYVTDVVQACYLSIVNKMPARSVIDVGTGEVTTVNDAANIIAKLHNAPEPQICGKFRDGDVRWAVSDAAEMQRVLGFSSTIGFEEGADRVGRWLVDAGYM